MKNKPTTILDIAKKLNITPSTVSRALNDHSRISDKTKKAVQKVAAELDYRPNNIASSLRKGRGKTIGVIVPQINRYFFSSVIHGIEEVTNERGYNMLICQSSESYVREKACIQLLADSRVDGILVSVSKETTDYRHLENVVNSNIPLIQFDRVIPALRGNSVVNDNWQGAYDSVIHLVKQGYRKIAHLCGPVSLKVFADRKRGYRDALFDSGLTYSDGHILEAITEETGKVAAAKLLVSADPPDAFFCSADYAALAVLNTALDLGMKVPEDVGIVGFANEPFTTMVRPNITTVEQYSEALGKESARLLLDEIELDGVESISQVRTIVPHLIIRESSLRTSASEVNKN